MTEHRTPIPAGGVPPRLVDEDPVAVKRCRHGVMCYNTHDSLIGRSLDLYGEWAEAELSVLGHLLDPGDVVLDVGANVGTHAVFFARAVAPDGVVLAFEAQRVVHQTLCANAALNGLTNLVGVHKAVGASRGGVRVPVLDPKADADFGGLRIEGHEQGEFVEMLSIDDLGLPAVKLIKVDASGMEAQVLRGAEQTVRRARPVLFVQNDTTEHAPDVIRAAEDLGYRMWWHVAACYRPDNFFGNPDNVFPGTGPQFNMLCVPSEVPIDVPGGLPVEGPGDNREKALARLRAAQGG